LHQSYGKVTARSLLPGNKASNMASALERWQGERACYRTPWTT
jgi:hypothetical protein